MNIPVFSRRDAIDFTPAGSDRSFRLSPLTFRERQLFRADVARDAGVYPTRAMMLDALRTAIREIGADNEAELLADIDAGEAAMLESDAAASARVSLGSLALDPSLEAAAVEARARLAELAEADARADVVTARARLAAVEAICSDVPVYALLVARQQRHLGLLPLLAARHCLRGWDGPGLPEFRRERGTVPEELLNALTDDEIHAIGWRADRLMRPGQAAEGNSAGLSPSPESPTPSTAA